MLTRLFLVAIVNTLLLVACRPTPSDPIEYLHREDSIIIQMLSVDTDASEFERSLAVPEFTLYGDGTLIYQHKTADGTRLLETTLPEDAVQKLVEDIVDEGFLDFLYDQPTPVSATSLTTFVYIQTRDLANAVSVHGEGAPLAADVGDEFDQYRTIQLLVETLRSLDPVALRGTASIAYLPESYLGLTRTLGDQAVISENVMASDEALDILGPAGGSLDSTLEELRGPFIPGPSRSPRETSFAPLLPFYENFPEFDLQ